MEEQEEEYLRQLIIGWYKRSHDVITGFTSFDKFISLWIAFNAWGTHESGRETDRSMVEWAKKNRILKRTFDEMITQPGFRSTLERLRHMCPIPRHRMWNGMDRATITDISWEEVLEVIYVIRCNLFHGRKSLQNIPDQQLVDLAYDILHEVFLGIITQLSSDGAAYAQ